MAEQEYTVSAARAADAPAIIGLWQGDRSAHATLPDRPEDVHRLLRYMPGSLLVAHVNGVIVGALIAAWDGWRGNMYRLAVLCEHRRDRALPPSAITSWAAADRTAGVERLIGSVKGYARRSGRLGPQRVRRSLPYERLRTVSFRYRVLYRVGFTPWDQDQVPAELSELVEGPKALAPGRALDVGCGTGTQAVYLAERGWQVTAVDVVERALERARRRAKKNGVDVRWVAGDVASLSTLGLDDGFGLVHDRGCFHDLSPDARDGYVRGVSELASPGATLLLLAFARRERGIGPSGASEEEIRRRFGSDWELVSVQSDSGPAPPGPMRRVQRIWYRLRRR